MGKILQFNNRWDNNNVINYSKPLSEYTEEDVINLVRSGKPISLDEFEQLSYKMKYVLLNEQFKLLT